MLVFAPSVAEPERLAGPSQSIHYLVWLINWTRSYGVQFFTSFPRRWTLPCHFPECSHERVRLPESFWGFAPTVLPKWCRLPLTSSPLSCIEHSQITAFF